MSLLIYSTDCLRKAKSIMGLVDQDAKLDSTP